MTPDGKHAYVSNIHPHPLYNSQVTLIDTGTDTAVGDISLPAQSSAGAIAISDDGARVYVADDIETSQTPFAFAGDVLIYTASNAIVGSPIAVSDTVFDIVIAPTTSFAFLRRSGETQIRFGSGSERG